MPTTLTPDGTQAIPNTVSGPADGPTAHAVDVNGPFQIILNWLSRALLRRIADFTALRAVSNQVDGERLYVSGFGYYEWRGSDTTAESLPNVVSPGGTGRWWKLDASLTPMEQVVARGYATAATGSTTSSSFVDVSGGAVTITGLKVGDVVDFESAIQLQGASGSPCFSTHTVTEGIASPVTLAEASRSTTASTALVDYVVIARRIVATAGDFTVKVRISNNDGTSSVNATVRALRVTVRRVPGAA